VTTYTLDMEGYTLRRFDTPEQREEYVAQLVWHWLGLGSTFEAEYVKDAVIIKDGNGNSSTIHYAEEVCL
jgi:hypothetical protein